MSFNHNINIKHLPNWLFLCTKIIMNYISIYIYSYITLVPLSCPSRAPLVPLSCTSRAPLVHLLCTYGANVPVSQPCQNEKYRVPFSAHKCTSRAPLVHLSCTSRAPLVHLLCTFGATVPVSQSCLKCVKIKNIVTLLQPMKVPL